MVPLFFWVSEKYRNFPGVACTDGAFNDAVNALVQSGMVRAHICDNERCCSYGTATYRVSSLRFLNMTVGKSRLFFDFLAF